MLKDLLPYARGDKEADLIFRNARIVDLFNGELVEADLAIAKGRIIGYGDYSAKESIDLAGRILAPGFIDGHLHLESSMVRVGEFASQVIATGTTTVFADPHEIANVAGVNGLEYILAAGKEQPWNFFLLIPSAVPTTSYESHGAVIDANEVKRLLATDDFFGLGEVMNYPGVINGEEEIWDKLIAAKEYFKDGHAPGLAGKELNAYLLGGIKADHEVTTVAEAKEKIRAGMYIMIREGSVTKDLNNLIKAVNHKNLSRFLFATDDRHPDDLIEEGHINYLIKQSIQAGIEPIAAVKMATLNAAQALGLDDLGAIAPGYKADLVVIDNWQDFNIDSVFKSGQLVAKKAKALFESKKVIADYPELKKTVNIAGLKKSDFILPAGNKYRSICLREDKIITDQEVIELSSKDRIAELKEQDLAKLAVVERHNATGNVGLGLLKGLGLKKGAIATSIAHDSHQIITAGLKKEDIFLAVKKLERMQGGIVVVADEEVLCSLSLSIAGLISEAKIDKVANDLALLKREVKQLGVKRNNPFMTLAFMALVVIPKLKLTDKGLFDVEKFSPIDLVIE